MYNLGEQFIIGKNSIANPKSVVKGEKYRMSFSKDVKVELSKLANLANKKEVEMEFLGYLLSKNISYEGKYIRFSTENDYNIDRFAKLIRNIGINQFNIDVNGKIFYIEFNKKDLENFSKFDLAHHYLLH